VFVCVYVCARPCVFVCVCVYVCVSACPCARQSEADFLPAAAVVWKVMWLKNQLVIQMRNSTWRAAASCVHHVVPVVFVYRTCVRHLLFLFISSFTSTC
jgi:hypothetical protein